LSLTPFVRVIGLWLIDVKRSTRSFGYISCHHHPLLIKTPLINLTKSSLIHSYIHKNPSIQKKKKVNIKSKMVRDAVTIGVIDHRPVRSRGTGLTGNWSGYDEHEFQRDLEDVRQLWKDLNQEMATRYFLLRRPAAVGLRREIRERLLRMASFLG
jgi:hypothetical protein